MAAGGPEDPIDPNKDLEEYAKSIGMPQPGEMPDKLRLAREAALRKQQDDNDNPEGEDTTPKE
ncbi:hypothetical protein C4564_03695 [Candidatus Microgenomates bacterium]|nr:MAG: hypothetical protein C4564_03695 [Candidatus Microgenomates bacterium]